MCGKADQAAEAEGAEILKARGATAWQARFPQTTGKANAVRAQRMDGVVVGGGVSPSKPPPPPCSRKTQVLLPYGELSFLHTPATVPVSTPHWGCVQPDVS